MNNINLKLNILLDTLKEKQDALITILNLCENQTTVLSSDQKTKEVLDFFKSLAQEKQKLIDKVLNLDIAFNNNYTSIESFFTSSDMSEDLKVLIREMQKNIQEIEQLTKTIKEQEAKNDFVISQMKSNVYSNKFKTTAKQLNTLYNNKDNI